MIASAASPYLVPFDGSFRIADAPSAPPRGSHDKATYKARLADLIDELDGLQRVFYADGRYSLLLIFQAMDAGGKDSTIRAVMTGVDPAGCEVHSFLRPSVEELQHDFLWRTTCRLPRRGRIGIFNRSYYEEVLVVRVHPELLEAQRLPEPASGEELWRERLESITDLERHLARNGTVIVKFWLNISRDEQRRRFLKRLQNPSKHWKFEESDVVERGYWDQYMHAYERALTATSRPWAPWFAIPADDKPFMQWQVARTIVDTLRQLPLRYPEPDESRRRHFAEALALLQAENAAEK